MKVIILFFVVSLYVRSVVDACTSILIGPDASEDGLGFVGQSDDGEGAVSIFYFKFTLTSLQ